MFTLVVSSLAYTALATEPTTVEYQVFRPSIDQQENNQIFPDSLPDVYSEFESGSIIQPVDTATSVAPNYEDYCIGIMQGILDWSNPFMGMNRWQAAEFRKCDRYLVGLHRNESREAVRQLRVRAAAALEALYQIDQELTQEEQQQYQQTLFDLRLHRRNVRVQKKVDARNENRDTRSYERSLDNRENRVRTRWARLGLTAEEIEMRLNPDASTTTTSTGGGSE